MLLEVLEGEQEVVPVAVRFVERGRAELGDALLEGLAPRNAEQKALAVLQRESSVELDDARVARQGFECGRFVVDAVVVARVRAHLERVLAAVFVFHA
jgi:hypothetical protein